MFTFYRKFPEPFAMKVTKGQNANANQQKLLKKSNGIAING